MIYKVINKKSKVYLQSSAIIQNTDFYCPKSYCFCYIIASKIQTQEPTAKKFYSQKSKVTKLRLALFTKIIKFFKQGKKAKKNKQNKFKVSQQDYIREQSK